MIQNLFENIQEHLSMLDLAVHCTERINIFARNEDLDRVISETENRDRIVNIVAKIQGIIEDQINRLSPGDVDQEGILILKAWFHDLGVWSDKMNSIDRETVEFLAQQKDETTKEIALIFKNKEMF
ncbi:MAG: hypothetical protein ACXVCE_03825, partial [Bacteriovorax sp.]